MYLEIDEQYMSLQKLHREESIAEKTLKDAYQECLDYSNRMASSLQASTELAVTKSCGE